MTIVKPTTSRFQSSSEMATFFDKVQTNYLLESPRVLGVERRGAERIEVTMPLNVVALDSSFRPLDLQYHAITRNMSKTGVGLVTNSPIGHQYLRLNFNPFDGSTFEAIARVIYCNEIGYYFQIGCEFILSDRKSTQV